MDLDSSSALTGAADLKLVAATQPIPSAAPAQATVAQPADAELMLRYARGDLRAFEILYARHKGGVYRYLKRMCQNTAAADDLFQEVWSRVVASRERYEVRAQFNTFLYRIAHNCAVDYLRKAGRERSAPIDVDDFAAALAEDAHRQPDAALAESQLRSAFRHALDHLPAEQRDVFVLFEESGMSLEDIGRITGVAMETAKSRLRYAVTKLRAALEQHRPSATLKGATP